MTANSKPASVGAVAPWWHTVFLIALIGVFSMQSAMNHGLPGFAVPGLDIHIARYLFIMLRDGILIGFIWIELRVRGRSLGDLIGGRWATAGSFFIDLGLAIAFAVVGLLVLAAISHFIGNTDKATEALLPQSMTQDVAWVALSVTAGFSEEFIFRGYLMRQFQAWSGSWIFAVIAQAAAFGLAHGYYFKAMISVAIYGCLLGLLAHWRKSLRPGMIAHALQDILSGV